MKKFTAFIATIAALTLAACSNGISDLDDDGQDGGSEITRESVAQYQYLGVMYDSTEGKALNDEVLQGEIYDIYRDKVQTALNVYLHFPLDQKNPIDQGAAGYAANALFDTTAPSLATPWYDTLPREIKIRTAGSLAEGIAVGIARFLKSAEGEAAVDRYLDKVQNRANRLKEHGVDELGDEFEDEINTLAGVFSATPVATALSGAMFIGSVSIAGLFMVMNGNNRFMGTLEQIRQQMADIQDALRIMERQQDVIMGIELEDYFGTMTNAQRFLVALYNQLAFLPNDDTEGRRDLIDTYIRTGVEYEMIFSEAFDKVQQNVVKYEEAKGVRTVTVPITLNIKTWDSYGGYCDQDFSFAMKNIMYHTKISLQDIALLKRLSETRLSLSREIYTGDSLLKYRSHVAKNDLKKVTAIKTLIDRSNASIQNYLDGLFNNETNYTYSDSYSIKLLNMFVSDLNVIQTLNSSIMSSSGNLNDQTALYSIVINKQVIVTFGEVIHWNGFINAKVIQTFGDVKSEGEFNEVLYKSIRDQIYYGACSDYFVQALTMLAEWEIHLKAHIKAAEGL